MVIRGDLTIGVLIALQLYLSKLAVPIGSSIRIIGSLMQGSIAAERIEETLKAENEKNDRLTNSIIPNLQGNIEFDNVCFGYFPEQMVLRNISLKIKPGMIVGITGPSGVGKTTLTNLLLRIYMKIVPVPYT